MLRSVTCGWMFKPNSEKMRAMISIMPNETRMPRPAPTMAASTL